MQLKDIRFYQYIINQILYYKLAEAAKEKKCYFFFPKSTFPCKNSHKRNLIKSALHNRYSFRFHVFFSKYLNFSECL